MTFVSVRRSAPLVPAEHWVKFVLDRVKLVLIPEIYAPPPMSVAEQFVKEDPVEVKLEGSMTWSAPPAVLNEV